MDAKACNKALGKTRRRAEFSGIVYLIGSLALAVGAYFPLVYALGTAGAGRLWVLNFWQAFTLFSGITTDLTYTIVSVLPSVLYAILLLVVTFNAISCLSKVHRLYRKLPSQASGYNRNIDSMEKMGKNFSSSFFAFIAIPYLLFVIYGARPTGLFWVGVVVGAIVHLWAGFVGAKTSWFDGVNEPIEIKRKLGRFAPFVRNLAQMLFTGLILVFLCYANTVSNLWKLLESGYVATLFADLTANKQQFITEFIFPIVQVVLVLFAFVLLKHTTATTEFNRDGKQGKGMKNYAIFSFFIFLVSALYVFAGYVFGRTEWLGAPIDVHPTLNMAAVAIFALMAWIEELCMSKLPNVVGKIEAPVEETVEEIVEEVVEEPVEEVVEEVIEEAVEEEEPAPAPAPAPPRPTVYAMPVQPITQPGVFMQVDGTPVLIMPMVPAQVYSPAPVQPVTPIQPAPAYSQPVQPTPPAQPAPVYAQPAPAYAQPSTAVVEEEPIEEYEEYEEVVEEPVEEYEEIVEEVVEEPVEETVEEVVEEPVEETVEEVVEEPAPVVETLPAPVQTPVLPVVETTEEPVEEEELDEETKARIAKARQLRAKWVKIGKAQSPEELPQRKKFTCSVCGAKLTASEEAQACRCPKCGNVERF